MIYDGPMSDEKIVIHVFPMKFTAELPLDYIEAPRDDLIKPGDMCWLTHDMKWGNKSMRVGERVNQYYCVVRKKAVGNQVTIE